MLSFIRKQLSATNLMVVAALIFAMAGGAYAANGGGGHHGHHGHVAKHKGKKGNKGGKRGPRGPRGKTGPAGEKGETGATGPAGPAGKNGTNGKDGTNGVNGKSVAVTAVSCGGLGGAEVKQEGATSGVEVCNGENGETGFTETLPEGKTLKGEWSDSSYAAGAGEEIMTGVSYGIPLSSNPTTHFIRPEESPPSGCAGSVEEPEAEPGNLCIFAAREENSLQLAGGVYFLPIVGKGSEESYSPSATGETEGGLYGFVIDAASEEEGRVILAGTWAVTEE